MLSIVMFWSFDRGRHQPEDIAHFSSFLLVSEELKAMGQTQGIEEGALARWAAGIASLQMVALPHVKLPQRGLKNLAYSNPW